jgi:hypothetical protein
MWLVSTYGAADIREDAQSYGKVAGGYMTQIQNGNAMNAPRMRAALPMTSLHSVIECIASPAMDQSGSTIVGQMRWQ